MGLIVDTPNQTVIFDGCNPILFQDTMHFFPRMTQSEEKVDCLRKSRDGFLWIAEGARYVLHGLFLLLCVRIVFVSLWDFPSSHSLALGLAAGVTALFSVRSIQWSLAAFFVAIPLLNGLQLFGFLQGIPLLTFLFACIYIAWFINRVIFVRKGIAPRNMAGNLADMLSGLVMLSLIFVLLLFPLDFLWYRFWSLPFMRQDDSLYAIDGASILLQGLFFFRVMDLEAEKKDFLKTVFPLFCFQAATIAAFFVYQAIEGPIGKHPFRVHYPFEDIHAYGSYILFLFFFFWAASEGPRKGVKALSMVFVPTLAIGVVFSYSRATWAAGLLVSAGFLWRKIGHWKWIWAVCGVGICLLYVNMFHADLGKSENRYMKRIGSLIIAEHFVENPSTVGRLVRWRIPLRMIEQNPITGSGIGAYFISSPSFVTATDLEYFLGIHRRWKVRENAHNYYLQFGAELGIPGLMIFLMIIAYAYRKGMNALKRASDSSHILRGLLYGLTAYLVTMLTGHPLLLASQQFLFWFAISGITVLSKPMEKERQEIAGPVKQKIRGQNCDGVDVVVQKEPQTV